VFSQGCGGEPDACNLEVDYDAKGDFYAMMCSYSPPCKLLVADACPVGTECHLQNTMTGLSVCVGPSTTQVDEGGACKYINDCKDMQYCYLGKCRYNCYLSAEGMGIAGLGGCPEGQTCTDQGFGAPDIGLCLP
jgi:hypothetical protein